MVVSPLRFLWLIDWIEIYAVSAIFQPCNGGYSLLSTVYMSSYSLVYPRRQLTMHNTEITGKGKCFDPVKPHSCGRRIYSQVLNKCPFPGDFHMHNVHN